MICFAQISVIIMHNPKDLHKSCASKTYFAQILDRFVRSAINMHNQCAQLLTHAQKSNNTVQNYLLCN